MGTGKATGLGARATGEETGERDRRVGTRETGLGDGRERQDGATGEGYGTGRRARRRERVFQYFTIRAAPKSGGVGALRFKA